MRHLGVSCAVLALLAGPACRSGQPLLVSAMGDKTTPGTIGGIVSAVGGDRLAGREVSAIHVVTSKRYSAVTNVTGGFSIKVPPGEYRLEVTLREGEKVVRQPGVVHINKSDLDANLEIVVGS
jgi:Carboxypeptidase regulatory-like domain